MEKLTKKEIKECKRNIYNYGVSYYGYWDGIVSEIAKIDSDLMLEITEMIYQNGYRIKTDGNLVEEALITEFCKAIGYQDFKKIVPWLLGFYGLKYENGELIQY